MSFERASARESATLAGLELQRSRAGIRLDPVKRSCSEHEVATSRGRSATATDGAKAEHPLDATCAAFAGAGLTQGLRGVVVEMRPIVLYHAAPRRDP